PLFEQVLNEKTLRKCDIRSYVAREVLLKELKDVDFFVHFPYMKGSQKSLKLVDYNFLQKPILKYKNNEFSNRVFKEFLEYNFENRREPEDWSKYKIENICTQFLELAGDEKQLVSAG